MIFLPTEHTDDTEKTTLTPEALRADDEPDFEKLNCSNCLD